MLLYVYTSDPVSIYFLNKHNLTKWSLSGFYLQKTAPNILEILCSSHLKTANNTFYHQINDLTSHGEILTSKVNEKIIIGIHMLNLCHIVLLISGNWQVQTQLDDSVPH